MEGDAAENYFSSYHQAVFRAQQWFAETSSGVLAERLMECIYPVSCQLIHGAATHGRTLNRTTIRCCNTMREHIRNSILVISIDQGLGQSSNQLCYPPVEPTTAAMQSARPR